MVQKYIFCFIVIATCVTSQKQPQPQKGAETTLSSKSPPPSSGKTLSILLYPMAQCRQSHLFNMEKIARILMDDGHHVTMLTSDHYDPKAAPIDLTGMTQITHPIPRGIKGECCINNH